MPREITAAVPKLRMLEEESGVRKGSEGIQQLHQRQ
jgi:hypothetical protein